MSNKNKYTTAERFRVVRKHLDNLGYKQAIAFESLPLIELLLVDLEQTKETLKHYQSIAQDNIEACSELQDAIEPYKCDNAKLVQEINQLNIELIETKESKHKQNIEFKKKIRKLESENNDLQLSCSKNIERIKKLEIESSNKSKKILELLGKCNKPVINSTNFAAKKRACYPLRKPHLEADLLPKTSVTTVNSNPKNVEPFVVNFVSMADHKITCLNDEIAELRNDLFSKNEYVETLKSQLSLKEKELERLKKMLEGGRPCSSINKDHLCRKLDSFNKSNSSSCELLITQQAKANLELQLKQALDKQHEATKQAITLAERNEELEKELREIDRLTSAIDSNSTMRESNKRVCRIQEKLDNVMTEVHKLQNELTVQRRECQELRADLEASKTQNLSIQRILEATLEEKKHMTDRINSLTANASKNTNTHCQKNSYLETQQSCTSRRTHDKDIIIDSLQHTIERLEEERDNCKEELRKLKHDSIQNCTKNCHDSLCSQVSELRTQVNEKEHAISKLLREKKELCQEKSNLENKIHCIQNQQSRSSSCKHCSFNKHSDVCRAHCDCSDPTNKVVIERLQCERDSARAELDRVTEEKNSLRERLKGSRSAAIHGLEDQLSDLKDELRRANQELSEQRSQYCQLRALHDQTDQALIDTQNQLTRAESELSKEIDRNKYIERQHQHLDIQIKELKQEINTYRSRVSHLDREKDQLVLQLDEKTEKIAALERELVLKEQQTGSVSKQVHDLQHSKQICIEQCADLERQIRSLHLEKDNLQRQLNSAILDREHAIQENRRIQDDFASVTYEVRQLTKELDASKAESADLKRQLQTYVSEVRRAEDLLCHKENERSDLLKHFRDLSLEATVLENNNHSLETEASEAKNALQSARGKIDDLERQITERDCLIREYELQVSELSQNVASLEIQLHQQTEMRHETEEDLRAANDLCINLEQQKDCYVQRLDSNTDLKSQYEAQLAAFKSEQLIIQDQIHKDHVKIDHLEKLLEKSREENITLHTNIQELENEITRLKRKINDLESKLCLETSDLRKYQTQAAEYSKQISELKRQITNERFHRAKKDEESFGTNCSNCHKNDSDNKENHSRTNSPKNCKCYSPPAHTNACYNTNGSANDEHNEVSDR